MLKKSIVGLVVFILISSFSLAKSYKIAVVPKGSSHEFWKAVQVGAEKAGKEFGADVTFRGPRYEDNTESQINLTKMFIKQGVDAIVLAPNEKKELSGVVKEAVEKGIKVVIIDSAVEDNSYESFVATDNFLAGKRAGQEMVKVLGKDSKIMIARYKKGNSSTEQRENGFMEALKEAGIKISVDEYAGTTVGTAYRSLKPIIEKNKDLNGIFAPNESATVGILKILKEVGMAGKVKLIGFDSSDAIVEGINEGAISGVIEQDPVLMGYLGVKAAIDALDGKAVEKRIVVDVKFVTK